MKFDFEYQCDREWDEMKGGDRRRFCDSCEKHVHHISGMTEEQARKFLEEHDYEVCVDFYRDGDGHTKFREAAKRLRLQNDGIKQLLASAAAVIPLALAAAFVDWDAEPPAPVALSAVQSTPNEPVAEPLAVPSSTSEDPTSPPPAPIDLSGPDPVIIGAPRVPTPEPPAPESVEEIPVEPFLAEPDEVEHDPEPVVRPVRLRGKIRRPADWGPSDSTKRLSNVMKQLPVVDFDP